MADLRRRAIGIVFQSFNLIPSLSALENVLLPTFFDDGRLGRRSGASARSICSSRSGSPSACITARRS